TAEDFVIRLSSRNAWQEFFRHRSSKKDDEYAFYQAIDKLERLSPEETRAKLSAVGISLEEVNEFISACTPTADLETIVANQRARGMVYYVKFDYRIILGLAYYTGVVFEAFDKKGDFRAIAGGGRYDNLIKLISNGKEDSSALGFGMGDVVLVEL